MVRNYLVKELEIIHETLPGHYSLFTWYKETHVIVGTQLKKHTL